MALKLFKNLMSSEKTSHKSWQRWLEVDGERLPVKVIEHPRSTRITLRLLPGGNELKVTMPPHMAFDELDEFLLRNRNWVAVKRSRLPQMVQAEVGANIPYLGIEHRIIHLDRLRGVVAAKQIAGEPSLLVPGEPAHIPRKVETFLKKQARLRLNEAVVCYSDELNVQAKSLRITDTTSRWGSCSTTRTLSFSWRIIMAPPPVLNYLVAHEVAHLREMNHSDRFWQLVEALCPDMKVRRSWLRNNGAKLHAVKLAS